MPSPRKEDVDNNKPQNKQPDKSQEANTKDDRDRDVTNDPFPEPIIKPGP